MNPNPAKYFSILRMIGIGMLMMSGMPSMCADRRKVSISLDGNTDADMTVVIDQGEVNPIVIRKDTIYSVNVSDVVCLNVFHKTQSRSLSYPINSSTTSIVLKPTCGERGVDVEIEQNTFFSSVCSFIASIFLLSNG